MQTPLNVQNGLMVNRLSSNLNTNTLNAGTIPKIKLLEIQATCFLET